MDLDKLVLPLEVADKAWKTGIAGAVAGVTALVGAMGVAIKTTFDWANELDSIGDVMDVTNEQAAAFGYIARKSGVDTATFTKGVVILSKGLVKADGSLDTTGKGLEEWGIKVKDTSGNLKSQTTLMDEVSKKYNTFATQQEKVNFLTQIFGRSGAELVDFFDVLAKEGGMDAVTQKVKAFGLAIDPARYEQFTRNLEELKLIGTGLAVTFTERIMPALEGMLGWVTRFVSAKPAAKLELLQDPLKKLFNLTDSFKRGVDKIDWAGLSKKIANGINNIDWNLFGQYVYQGVSNVLQGIGTVLSEIDWQALFSAAGNALSNLFTGLTSNIDFNAIADSIKSWVSNIDWAALGQSLTDGISNIDWNLVGQTIRDFLKNAISNTSEIMQWWQDTIGAAIQEIDWQALSDSVGGALAELVAGLYGYPDWETLKTDFNNGFASLFGYDTATAFADMRADFERGALAIGEPLVAFGEKIIAWWNQLWIDFDTGANALGETFIRMYNTAAEWVNKLINLIAKIPVFGGSPKLPMASPVQGGQASGGRASGGAVIAGQQYNVGEFNRPEKFTPSVNGRVDPLSNSIGSQEVLDAIRNSRIDENKLGRIIVTALKQGWAN